MNILKKISTKKFFFSLLLLIFIIPSISFARYYEKIENIKVKSTIAEPIFKVVNNQEIIIRTINKESVLEEYVFSIKNFEVDEITQIERISQVDMGYTIQIINEKGNFPIAFKLYEVDSGEEILKGKECTDFFKIPKNIKYEKIYKLSVVWEEKSDILDVESNVKIIVNASQIK